MKEKGILMNEAPSVSYTSEAEQRRITVASRFVVASKVLSDDDITQLSRNENHDRIPFLLQQAARLSYYQAVALKTSLQDASSTMKIPSELAEHWESRWKAVYQVRVDLAGLVIPRPPTHFKARFAAMHEKGNSTEFLYRGNEKLMGKHWKFCGGQSLDEGVPKHSITGTFGCWVEDDDEAPFGSLGGINLSANAVRELRTQFGLRTATLPVRLVLGADVFLENDSKKHLDRTVFTLCPESETAAGHVPGVYFSSARGEVYVSRWYLGGARDDIRFRRAIYP